MNETTADAAGLFELNHTYEPYSNDPDYIEGNRGFIRSLPVGGTRRILDLACGIGTLSNLIWEIRPAAGIVGVDLSREGLVIARERYREAGRCSWPRQRALDRDGGNLGLVAASADALPLEAGIVDGVVMGHSIHMIEDHARLLREVRRVLRPGGFFAFNTSFYAGTFASGTEEIYHDWVKRSLTYIQERDRELRRRGLPGVRRKRGSVAPAFSRTWPSAEEWVGRLEGSGFAPPRVARRTVNLTEYSFRTIGAYGGFASVILSGYPVPLASEALQAAAGPTFRAFGVHEVPRHWLEITAMAL